MDLPKRSPSTRTYSKQDVLEIGSLASDRCRAFWRVVGSVSFSAEKLLRGPDLQLCGQRVEISKRKSVNVYFNR